MERCDGISSAGFINELVGTSGVIGFMELMALASTHSMLAPAGLVRGAGC